MAAPTHDEGLTPITTTDCYMAAAVDELRAAVGILREIKDALVRSLEPKAPFDLSDVRVKEPTAKRK
jgi:hypothetical protein